MNKKPQPTIISIVILFLLLSLTPFQTVHSEPTTDSVTLLIIAPFEFTPALEPLVLHKEHYGISTRLVSVEEVYDQMFWQGRDPAEKIKYFIKNAVEEWGTQYVLLVGGMIGQMNEWYVPVRYVQMDDNWESEYLSDLYFADIYDEYDDFSSWDTDGDGIYGEWYYEQPAEDDNIDLSPDVAVGRLPCRCLEEVMIMVDKIIMYETYASGGTWFNDFVVVAGDTYPVMHNPNWTGNEGEYYGDLAIDIMDEFTPIRLYTSDGSFSGERDVITTISDGCGFLYFNGHGNPQTWGNHPPNDEEFVTGLTTKTMPRLRNGERLPICVVGGCHNCQFDVTLLNLIEGIMEEGLQFFKHKFYYKEWVPECWGWRMTRKLGGGSIATLGCSALGYTKEDKDSFTGGMDEVELNFFTAYSDHGYTHLGDAWKASLQYYQADYPINWSSSAVSDSWIDTKVMQSWVLFGDPSLKIGGYPSTPCIE